MPIIHFLEVFKFWIQCLIVAAVLRLALYFVYGMIACTFLGASPIYIACQIK